MERTEAPRFPVVVADVRFVRIDSRTNASWPSFLSRSARFDIRQGVQAMPAQAQVPTRGIGWVAVELTAHDALSTHLRDEPGIHDATRAPIRASFSSAVSFCLGTPLPIRLVLPWKGDHLEAVVGVASLALVAGPGARAVQLGDAWIVRAASRVLIWGALAMALPRVSASLLPALESVGADEKCSDIRCL